MNWKQHRNPFLIGVSVTLLGLALLAIVPTAFRPLDRVFLRAKYSIRGESKIDSSIIIIYFTNEDIAALGGLPLRRSYYALLISALNNLGVKTIGIDIALTEPDFHGDEYDDLLASVMKKSGNVVLSGYFHSVVRSKTDTTGYTGIDTIPNRFTMERQASPEVSTGVQPVLPIPKLLDAAAGFGHTIIDEDGNIPLLIHTQADRAVPAFAYALLRSALTDVGEGAVEGGENLAKVYSIPGASNGEVSINFAGGAKSLNMLQAGEFLSSYSAWQMGGTRSEIVEPLKGKIALVGIIAEGRSAFIETPCDRQFPSIGVHATFLHNALHQKFLRTPPVWLESLLLVVLGLCSTFLMTFTRERVAFLTTSALLIGLNIVSFVLFSMSYDLPLAAPSGAILLIVIGIVANNHAAMRRNVRALIDEKSSIALHLRESERALVSLETRLDTLQKETNESAGLREEIRKYETEMAQLRVQAMDVQPFSEKPAAGRQEFHGIVCSAGSPMADAIAMIEKIAGSDATVLITGESGTGKELVARAIHELSRRDGKPFITVNCGALTETLLESELFGHERGAFTGAIKEKPGRFELAADGTIFLDEIAETSEGFQVRLLRVLQDKTFERVGGTQSRRSNARVIAATNRDLRHAVAEKSFREDLFYRLNVLPISLPPLRERPVDIPPLVEHFMHGEREELTCSVNVMDILRHYSWPGNVRELQSAIIRAAILARANRRNLIRITDLPEEITSSVKSTRDFEEQIISALRDKQFSRSAISDTADELGGLNRGTVAEYFRGYCFKVFVESVWVTETAVERIAQTPDQVVRERVSKKLIEYLQNALEFVNPSMTLEHVQVASRPKFKNLPQRYHPYLVQVIAAACRGEYSLDAQRAPTET